VLFVFRFAIVACGQDFLQYMGNLSSNVHNWELQYILSLFYMIANGLLPSGNSSTK
jgi:hypothetical protein